MARREQSELIRQFIIGELAFGGDDVREHVTQQFGIQRHGVNRHLREMAKDGIIEAIGSTSARRYRLRSQERLSFELKREGLQEDVVWSERVAPEMRFVQQNVYDAFYYGFTEILNNAIDHSDSEAVEVRLLETAETLSILVTDTGVGIFSKVANERHLPDERSAILEIAKGKLTTDPKRHSGQGIFFTSRLMDRFSIRSGQLGFRHVRPANDWITEETEQPVQGTNVEMTLRKTSTVETTEIFDRYARPDEDDYSFSRTHVPIVLAKFDELLVSRSQAKRVLQRIDQFKEVVFDFANIEFIGQAFADEIFRVFANAHPDVTVAYRNAVPRVLGMIKRAQPGGDADGQKTLF